MKRSFIIGAVVAGLGLAALVGPPDCVHHWLHKTQVLGIFDECCCIQDSGHTDCGWSDHFGHSWTSHGKIAKTAVGVFLAGLLMALIGARWRRTAATSS